MFSNQEPQDYYAEAIKDARVNHLDSNKTEKSNKGIFLIFNFIFFLSVGGYLGYDYLSKDNALIKKTSVMGVTYTSNDENRKLEALLEEAIVDDIEESAVNEVALSKIVETSSSNSAYITSLNEEINPQKPDQVNVVVREGDTLQTLASRYYGDPLAYTKILEDNPDISKKSNKIYAGQIIRLTY